MPLHLGHVFSELDDLLYQMLEWLSSSFLGSV
ncbi:hypothetical protein T09_4401 [Trichinella sp. T9]|nr:hypothetical protein T09_4401 [Trichinella sp. T9]